MCAVLQQILLKLFSLSTASTNDFLDSFYSEYIEDNIIKVYFVGFMGQKIYFSDQNVDDLQPQISRISDGTAPKQRFFRCKFTASKHIFHHKSVHHRDNHILYFV